MKTNTFLKFYTSKEFIEICNEKSLTDKEKIIFSYILSKVENNNLKLYKYEYGNGKFFEYQCSIDNNELIEKGICNSKKDYIYVLFKKLTEKGLIIKEIHSKQLSKRVSIDNPKVKYIKINNDILTKIFEVEKPIVEQPIKKINNN